MLKKASSPSPIKGVYQLHGNFMVTRLLTFLFFTMRNPNSYPPSVQFKAKNCQHGYNNHVHIDSYLLSVRPHQLRVYYKCDGESKCNFVYEKIITPSTANFHPLEVVSR